jgi:hypothetical protein
MTKDECDKLMKERGFTMYATIRDNGNTKYTYMHDNAHHNIACDVLDLDGGQFFILSAVHGLFTVTSGRLSPLSNNKHFDKFYTTLRDMVLKLKYGEY